MSPTDEQPFLANAAKIDLPTVEWTERFVRGLVGDDDDSTCPSCGAREVTWQTCEQVVPSIWVSHTTTLLHDRQSVHALLAKCSLLTGVVKKHVMLQCVCTCFVRRRRSNGPQTVSSNLRVQPKEVVRHIPMLALLHGDTLWVNGFCSDCGDDDG